MRPLTLHVSALNDAEYDLYTSCLHDLIDAEDDDHDDLKKTTTRDDSYYECMKIGVRELRAWLRGRYPELATADLDSIFKFFHASVAPGDALTGGQFFAVLRLVTHLRSGKGVDRALVFVQAYPEPRSSHHKSPQSPQVSLQRHRSSPYPSQSGSPLRRASDASSPSQPPNSPFLPTAESIRRKSSESHAHPPPQHPDNRPQNFDRPQSTERPPPPPVPLKPNNPFLTRRLRSATNLGDVASPKIPPLPPRKPPPLLPPRNASLMVQPQHAVTPLMRQSLEASKVGQSVRAMEERLGKERVLEVVRSSSSVRGGQHVTPSASASSSSSSSGEGGGGVKSAPALPTRRRHRSPESVGSVGSARSFEQVAKASVSTNPFGTFGRAADAPFPHHAMKPKPKSGLLRTPSTSPSRSPAARSTIYTSSSTNLTTNLNNLSLNPSNPKPKSPPPTHPDRKPPPLPPASLSAVFDPSPPDSPTTSTTPSSAGGTPRVSRSKSMHHPSPPPIPPPRRRRPESVQVVGSVDLTEPSSARPDAFQSLSRHISLGSHNVQRRLEKLQPRLDAARYKAEAGLSRRGFVSHPAQWNWKEEGEEALMGDADAGEGVDPDGDGEWSVDGESPSEERGRARGAMRGDLEERDSLKWPRGEGWAPL